MELIFVGTFYLAIDSFFIGAGRLLENGGQGCAGVFGVNIDSSGEDGLVADEGAGKVEPALDREMGARFDDLCEELSENQLLGEIFGADYDTVRMSGAAGYGQEQREGQEKRTD